MLCSRLLKAPDPRHRGWEEKLTYYIDRGFLWLRGAYERRLHRSLNYLPVTVVFALVVLGKHLLFVYHRPYRACAAGGSGRHPVAIDFGAECHAAAAAAIFARGLQDFLRAPRDRARLPDRHARPIDLRHGAETLGLSHQVHQCLAAGGAAGIEQDRGHPGGRVSTAAAAGQHRTAGSVRDRHHRIIRAPVRHCAEVSARGAAERQFYLSRLRSQDRQSAVQHHHRSRQDRAARPEDERRRQRARFDAGRRLCQLFQHERPLV